MLTCVFVILGIQTATTGLKLTRKENEEIKKKANETRAPGAGEALLHPT
jgi:hypothetical protein